jgi:DNA replication and repair protein RecF
MLADLRLQNFRSYNDQSFDFSSNVNIIVGPNASGKTNLLEAVLMLAKGKSYRAKDSELIQFNKDWSKLTSELTEGTQRILKLAPLKSFEIEGKEYKRLSLEKTLPVVLFEPNHLQLLSGSPEKRRDYLDDLLEQTTPGYSRLSRQYIRTLSQRNNLLKQPNLNKNHIFPWDIKLSQLAGQIVRQRVNLTKNINDKLKDLYQELSGDKTITEIRYINHWPIEVYETNFLKGLEASLDTDKIRGFTSLGPHREDFEIILNNHNSQLTASRGETRTVLLALKIIELQIIETVRDQKPILLLDDVFSELDSKRRQHLVSNLKEHQVFVTTTDADLISKDLKGKSNTIHINQRNRRD